VNDSASTPKNVAVTVPALINDSDPDGGRVEPREVNPTNGIASIVGTNVVFTPATNFLGRAHRSVTRSPMETVEPARPDPINSPNRPPIAVNDSTSTRKHHGHGHGLINDTDPDGDAWSSSASTQPTASRTSPAPTSYSPRPPISPVPATSLHDHGRFGGTNFALIIVSVTNRRP